MFDNLKKFFDNLKNNHISKKINNRELSVDEKMVLLGGKKLSIEEKIALALKKCLPESDILTLINSSKFDVNYMDKEEQCSLLTLCVRYDELKTPYNEQPSFKIQNALLEMGADPLKRSDNRRSAIEMAIFDEQYNPNMFKPRDVSNFASKGKGRLFLQDPSINHTLLTAVLSSDAYSKKTVEFVKALIEMDPKLLHTPNSEGVSPIQIALNKNENILFDSGQVIKVFEVLVQKGAISKEMASDYLINTLQNKEDCNCDKALVLLENVEGINLSYKDSDGNTFAHYWAKSFAKNYHISFSENKITQKLYPMFDINAQNKSGETPMMLAIKEGVWHETVCHFDDVDGYTCSRASFIEKMLADPKFDPLVQDNQGLMSYHYARKYPLQYPKMFFDLEAKTNEALEKRGIVNNGITQTPLALLPKRVAHQGSPRSTSEQHTME